MLKRLLVALALLACVPLAHAQQIAPDVSSTRIPVYSSATGAASSVQAQLAGMQGKYVYICGFAITSTGSTAAAVVSPTVAFQGAGSMTFTYASVAGATLANAPLIVNFTPCVPHTLLNQPINVQLPSLGAGNTNATVDAWGYYWNNQ